MRQLVLLRRVNRIVRWSSVLAIVLLLTACSGDTHLSFLDAQGPIAQAQRWHFYWVLAIMAIMVAAPIFVLLPFWVWRYRYGARGVKYDPKWQFSRLLEIMAWSGPIVIVAILAFFVWRDARKLDPYRPIASAQAPLQIQVIGYDWKWLFIYPDQGIASIGTLALPVGRPVSLRITSATVMQSLFVPALGSQIYAMGGMVSQLNLEASKPGRSLGENTMYNGDGFHQQHFIAQSMAPEDFKAWVAHARTSGRPMDAGTLQRVAKRGTRSALIAALPASSKSDGNLYFNSVSRNLFPAVVKSVMRGSDSLPANAFDPAAAASTNPPSSAHATSGQPR